MTIGEFEGRRDKGRDKFVIRVFKHKTSSTGPANIVMSKQYEKVICQYFDLMHSQVIPQSKELRKRFFLTTSSNSF